LKAIACQSVESSSLSSSSRNGELAQSGRALHLQCRGSRIVTDILHQLEPTGNVGMVDMLVLETSAEIVRVGSSPTFPTN
jgi:hypothetical protein